MNIVLNVSGKHFEIKRDVLLKIPYFYDMFDMCEQTINAPIFIGRSSHVFKHILAFTIDPLYPYPLKLEYELKFYGINYDKSKLYDKNIVILKNINDVTMNTNDIKNMFPHKIRYKCRNESCHKDAIESHNYCHRDTIYAPTYDARNCHKKPRIYSSYCEEHNNFI